MRPYLPKVPRDTVDVLGRALVDETLLGEHVLLPLFLGVQVHSVCCGGEGGASALGLVRPRVPADLASGMPTPRGQVGVSEAFLAFNLKN